MGGAEKQPMLIQSMESEKPKSWGDLKPSEKKGRTRFHADMSPEELKDYVIIDFYSEEVKNEEKRDPDI